MGLKGCANFLKYSMFFFNSIILIAGCALLGVGIFTRTNQTGLAKVTSVLGSHIYSICSILLIVCGCIVVLLSFLGCCGAIKEVRCMLGSFFVLLLLMFLALLVGGILAYAFHDDIENYTKKQLYISLNTSYGMEEEKQVTEAWNSLQQLFTCCGIEGNINSSTSWAYYKGHTRWFDKQDFMKGYRYVPDSCCRDQEAANISKCVGISDKTIVPFIGPSVPLSMENDQLYTQGCYTILENWISSNASILGGVAVGIAGIMVLGMVFALCLCRRIKDEYAVD